MQVLRGLLPGETQIQLQIFAQMLLPLQIQRPFAESAGDAGNGVGRYRSRTVVLEVPMGVDQRERVGSSAAPAVAELAAQPEIPEVVGPLLARSSGRVCEFLVFVAEVGREAEGTAFRQRIAQSRTGDDGLAVGVQSGKIIAEGVVDPGMARIDLQAARSQIGIVAEVVVVQSVEAGQPAQAEAVADAREVVEVNLRAETNPAGVAAAPVVGVERTADLAGVARCDDEVGAAGTLAGHEGGTHFQTRDLARDQQGPFQRCTGDDRAAAGGAEDAAQEGVFQVGVALDEDLPICAGHDGDVDVPVRDLLRRDIGEGEQIPPVPQVGGEAGRQGVQAAQGMALAFFPRQQFHQFGCRNRQGSAQTERADRDGPRIVSQLVRPAVFDFDGRRGGFSGGHQGRQLAVLQDAAGVRTRSGRRRQRRSTETITQKDGAQDGSCPELPARGKKS